MNPTQQTLELLKTIRDMGGLGALDAGELAKAGINIATGLVAYDLEPVAQRMYPVITPLRNEIPRVGGGIGTGVHYMQVTGIKATSLGVAEGHRGGVADITVVPKSAAWATLGQEIPITFEAEESSLLGTDNRSLAALALLDSLFLGEEVVLLGGNNSLALLQTPTPDAQDVAPAAGQSFKAKTKYVVNCVALTLEGYINASLSHGIDTAVTRTNADGIQDMYGGGAAQVSNPAPVTTGDDADDRHALKCSVAAVKGAVAYAWFWGPDGGDIKLGAITTIDSILITNVAPGGTQKVADLPASDQSCNRLVYDGLITQICTPGSGAYVAVMPTGTPGVGTPLNSDGAGGIDEINTALKAFWDNYRLSPDVMEVNAQEINNITNKVIAGGGTPLFRFNVDAQGNLNLSAGSVIGTYLNRFAPGGGKMIQVRLHPNVPPGTIIFRCLRIPYAMPGGQNIIQVKTIRDYYQIDWPLRTRQFEAGVYTRGVLMVRFAPAFGAIFNIANG